MPPLKFQQLSGHRPSEGLQELVALTIDGVHFADHLVLATVGIDRTGGKDPLALREGATENAAACRALLANLIERGLNPNRAMLVVIDGAKALRKAVREVFGERAAATRIRNATSLSPCRSACAARRMT